MKHLKLFKESKKRTDVSTGQYIWQTEDNIEDIPDMETFTHEMAQEIIYYFGEDSDFSEELDGEFTEITNGISFIMYEDDYSDMKNHVKSLLKFSTDNPDKIPNLINLYKDIRKDIGVFPHVCDLEDIYLDLIENEKFDFSCSFSGSVYSILLMKENKCELKDFMRYCNTINNSLLRLNGDFKSELSHCEYYKYSNDRRNGSNYLNFKIRLSC